MRWYSDNYTVYFMEIINWHNCAEQMPQDDGEIIIKSDDDQRHTKANKLCLDYCLFFHPNTTWYWTEFTEEKWKWLNETHTK